MTNIEIVKKFGFLRDGNDIKVARPKNLEELKELQRGTIVENIVDIGSSNIISYFCVYEHIQSDGKILFDVIEGEKIFGVLYNQKNIEFKWGRIYASDKECIDYGKNGRRLSRAREFFTKAGLLNPEREK